MQLESVKETAERFNISERRVQKLCEEGRIEGAQMISNVWVIPSNSSKPVDERVISSNDDMLSLSELCKELSISVATGRNWVKLGKLIPTFENKRTPFFSTGYVQTLKSEIRSGKKAALKSRRNKKYVSGNEIYNSYVSEKSVNIQTVQSIVSTFEEAKVSPAEDIIRAIIAESAIQFILEEKGETNKSNALLRYIHNELPNYQEWFLVEDIIEDKKATEIIINQHPEFFQFSLVYERTEDVLGLMYISLLNIGDRKATGSYYTPTKVVHRLCQKLFERNNLQEKDVFDPCCGTGNFIIQLPDEIGYEHVYGNDIDSLSVRITRVNFALKYGISDPSIVYSHITEKDYLSFADDRQFDFIIGNPPWGYDYSDLQKEKLRNKYKSAHGSSIESYDVFVEQAIRNLKMDGVLSFILPEAILNVKTHTPIREVVLNSCDFQYLDYLGNAFDGVQCPCIILQLQYKNRPFKSIGLSVCDGKREYSISSERRISSDYISFTTTDEEYEILKKMDELSSKVTLEGHARFALGIVTGNNKEYITQEKTDKNEMVLKGSDLCKYKFKPSTNYLSFKPESFQQVAPTDYYRAPEKLLYRFICNQLVFAYDDKQTLSLNSCNILIPEIPNLDMKYVLAILNSRCMQFYFKKQFNSVKILRSHIEALPIPVVPITRQQELIKTVDAIIASANASETNALYDELDDKISVLYGITSTEYSAIRSSMEDENLFLDV